MSKSEKLDFVGPKDPRTFSLRADSMFGRPFDELTLEQQGEVRMASNNARRALNARVHELGDSQ